MTISELAKQLATRTESLCRRFLPQGTREGDRWHAGSLDGDKGRSLHVNLSGEHAGHWRDEATGEYGDIIDLWRLTQRLSMPETLEHAKAELGIASPEKVLNANRQTKTWAKPKPVVGLVHEGTAAWQYLTDERKIPADTIRAFKPGEESGALIFRYCDHTGKRHVHSKHLKLSRENGKKQTWVSKGTQPVLYGWQAVEDKDRSVVICEGEIDCMTLRSLGIPALSVPMGAGNKQDAWIASEYEHLDRFETLWVWMDNDDADRAATDNIVQRFGSHRCRVVEWPDDLPEGCDVNDLVVNHGWGIKDVGKLVLAAQYRGPEELASAGQFKAAVDETFEPAPEAQALHFRLPWANPDQPIDFRPGDLSIWSGYGGSGKSLKLGQLVLYACARGLPSVIASLEMAPADTLHRMIRQASAQVAPQKPLRDEILDWLDDKLWLFRVVGSAKRERLLEVCEYAVRRYGVRHFVIDSLMKLGIRDDDYSEQKIIVEELSEFAARMQTHVHLVAHSRKPNGNEAATGFSIKGSGGIRDLADNVLIVRRNKQKEDVLADPESTDEEKEEARRKFDCILTVDKNRRHGWEGPIFCNLHLDTLQYLPPGTHAPLPIYQRPYRDQSHG